MYIFNFYYITIQEELRNFLILILSITSIFYQMLIYRVIVIINSIDEYKKKNIKTR